MLKPKFHKDSSCQLSFSQLRIKSAFGNKVKKGFSMAKKFVVALLRYSIYRIVFILKIIKRVIFGLVFTAFNIKNFLVGRLIWSRGRLGKPFANMIIVFLALSVFLTGGVFQSKFVVASKVETEFISGSNDIIPEPILARTETPADRIREDYIEYFVQGGETLSSIGQEFGVTVESIRYANDLVSLDYLKVGQKLLIPPVSGVIHTVKSGDSLSSLASKYAVSTQAIADFNYLDGPPFDLSVGQKLIIPGAKIPALVVPAPVPTYGQDAYGQIPYAQIGVKGTGQFVWPARYRVITQYFSWYHPAIDIVKSPSPIYASDAGTVVRAGWWTNGYGFAVQVDHGNGYVTTYAHMSVIEVSVGEEVGRGEIIGQMGSTGRSTGPHVHFSVQFNGRFLDPLSVL
ncbi:MAG: M23 family metallopeptidase [Patescibacteria group bacterium]|nr:M23 family metallopeptidase [Patescibacteria group bacterium]